MILKPCANSQNEKLLCRGTFGNESGRLARDHRNYNTHSHITSLSEKSSAMIEAEAMGRGSLIWI
jgi:hypothetical protein